MKSIFKSEQINIFLSIYYDHANNNTQFFQKIYNLTWEPLKINNQLQINYEYLFKNYEFFIIIKKKLPNVIPKKPRKIKKNILNKKIDLFQYN